MVKRLLSVFVYMYGFNNLKKQIWIQNKNIYLKKNVWVNHYLQYIIKL